MKQLLPKVNLLRCYKHLKDELLKSHDGRASLETYEKLTGLPKVQNGHRESRTYCTVGYRSRVLFVEFPSTNLRPSTSHKVPHPTLNPP